MLKNYFLVALRNFWRNKTFSLINILGLAIGISASLVIFLVVYYDLSFDKFEPRRDGIYRVVAQFSLFHDAKQQPQNCLPVPMAVAIGNEVTGVEEVVPIHTWGQTKVMIPYPNPSQPKTLSKQKDLVVADARYTNLIGYTWLCGSPATALAQPYEAVLTEKNARLYFPNMEYTDILGKTLTVDDTVQATVTGIVKDLPGNSDFYFGTIISHSTMETARLKQKYWESWRVVNAADQLFVLLKPGANPDGLASRLSALFSRYQDPLEEAKVQVQLQPLSDLHFDTNYDGFDDGRTAHKATLYGLIIVATILLLLACINFVNLTTAQGTQRAKEIGIRKTMGSRRGQLAFQFLSETFVLTALATLLSVVITPVLLQVFSDLIPKDFHFSYGQPAILLFLVVLILVVTLLSGFYPAVVMSMFNPVLALKNQVHSRTAATRSAWFRRTLTVSQFAIAQMFIIGTILVGRQISFAIHMDMGFRKDAILFFRTNWQEKASKKNVLAAKLLTTPGIDMISVASDPPATEGEWTDPISYNDGHQDMKYEVQAKEGDSNYFRLFHLRLVAGNAPPQSDKLNAVVINQSLAKILGFRDAQAAVGKTLGFQGGNNMIVGVVADFHQRSAHRAIEPMVISNGSGLSNEINVALHPSNGNPDAWPATIARIEKAFHTIYPADDFNYYFVDETISKYYTSEQQTARLLAWATGLAIFISCLGLLGLVIYITNQRTKEIGIRKVVGASVVQIVILLLKDFIRLVGLAVVIALPIAWWGSHKWLDNFAYRVDLSWWIFAAGGLGMTAIALITLSVQTVRAGMANPVNALKAD